MIISASRRTDIPRYFGEWFIRRVYAGYCVVKNPFFPEKQYRISLGREDVDCFVFWTRFPKTLMPYLNELDTLHYRYYFLYTVVDYPGILEPSSPSVKKRVGLFRRLGDTIGAERTVWRYDPIYISRATDFTYHLGRFRVLAEQLKGYTRRVIISFYDPYRKTEARLKTLPAEFRPAEISASSPGTTCTGCTGTGEPGLSEPSSGGPAFFRFVSGLAETANAAGMEIQSCAEKDDLTPAGIPPGSCIDAGLIRRLFGIHAPEKKDPNQRTLCRCVISRDIGAYDTCMQGCVYCYATGSRERVRARHGRHDPEQESLV